MIKVEHHRRMTLRSMVFAFCSIFLCSLAWCQNEAKIYEEKQMLNTYGFGDPSPIPEMGRIYPYFKFEDFESQGQLQSWNMVVLENDYIKVWVIPEIGGKVWGAIDKKTGKDFIYKNDAVKFRAIALRGPWTSGGIEFNFGVIGHSPTVGTPVDYQIKKNSDGSVSCILGHYDFPSRTRWTVEVRLQPNAGYFSTISSWINPSPLISSHFNWSNAAFRATSDFQFLYPGNHYIGHEGKKYSWPKEGDRDISFYQQNTIGDFKSYHVLNTYTHFFGGYWHDEDFGFGHLVDFSEKPGKKVWIWGLSRQGMIWENLLTDSHGQYVETQSGNLFNQPVEGSSKTPFKHTLLYPGERVTTEEKWFPMHQTQGAKTANDQMVINLSQDKDSEGLKLSVMALSPVSDDLSLYKEGELFQEIQIRLSPLETKHYKLNIDDISALSIVSKNEGELFDTSTQAQTLERPLTLDPDYEEDSLFGLWTQGLEWEAQREFHKAAESFQQVIERSSSFTSAYAKLAMYYYRQGLYQESLQFSKKALSQNTYHPEANFAYGIAQLELNQWDDAQSGFSIASQGVQFRVMALLMLSRIALLKKQYRQAIKYADKALSFNQNFWLGWQYKALAYKRLSQERRYKESLVQIETIDPTYQFVAFENYLAQPSSTTSEQIKQRFLAELSDESLMELAHSYVNVGFYHEAIACFQLVEHSPLASYWLAYLYDKLGQSKQSEVYLDRALSLPNTNVFPYRIESLKALGFAKQHRSHWTQDYYQALILDHVGRADESLAILNKLSNKPGFFPFYLYRSQKLSGEEKENDLQKAVRLAPKSWRAHWYLAQALSGDRRQHHVLKAYELNSNDVRLIVERARLFYQKGQYGEAVAFLENQNVLPANGGLDARGIYFENALMAAFDALKAGQFERAMAYVDKAESWPENLGAGKPSDYDNRIENFFRAIVLHTQNKSNEASEFFNQVLDYSGSHLSTELLAQLYSARIQENKRKENDLISHYQSVENEWISWSLKMFDQQVQMEQSHLTFKQKLILSLYDWYESH